MNRSWQPCAALAFGHRRASVASTAWAVRPASLAASARVPVFQSLGASAQNCNILEPLRSLGDRVSHVTVAPELIARFVSRKVGAMRPSPNSNTNQKVSIRPGRAMWQASCSFGSVSGVALPVGAFGLRAGPNPSFKRTCLRQAA